MSRRTAQVRYIDEREETGAVAFDAALEAYLEDGYPEHLLRAAGMAIDCDLPIGRRHADTIFNLTGEAIEIETYSDAAHAIRRWFAVMRESGPRH
jgi:hypothetical protein